MKAQSHLGPSGPTAGQRLIGNKFTLALEKNEVRAFFESEAEARELYACLARHAKGLPSGLTAALTESPASGAPELLAARALRLIVKEDIPLTDFLGCCVIDVPRLLAFVAEADADQKEKEIVTQKILKFQARARLQAV